MWTKIDRKGDREGNMEDSKPYTKDAQHYL